MHDYRTHRPSSRSARQRQQLAAGTHAIDVEGGAVEHCAIPQAGARAVAITARDGARLWVTRLGAASVPASVIYLHCPLADASYWDPLTQYLQQRLDGGIAQLTCDARDSAGRPTGRVPAASVLSADVLDAVVGQAQGAAVLVAHSLASLPVLAWAEKYPARAYALAGLVFLNPCTALEPPYLSNPTAPQSSSGPRVYEFAAHLPAEPGSDRSSRRIRVDPGPGLPLSSHTAEPNVLAGGTLPVSENVVAVLQDVPTWVVTGDLDPLAPPRHARTLAEQLWSEFDSVPGVGHCLPYREPIAASAPILAALEVAYRAQRFGGDLR